MASQAGRRRHIATEWSSIVIMLGFVAVTATLAGAAPALAGTLARVSWTASNAQTGASSTTYSLAFTTATVGTVGSVTMTVPTGTAGTPAVSTVYGLAAGSVRLAGDELTYTLASPESLPAGVPVALTFSGLTNTTVAGPCRSTVTTRSPSRATIDAGGAPALSFGASSTAVSVIVEATLVLADDDSASGGAEPTSRDGGGAPALSVRSNDASGYTVTLLSSEGACLATPRY